MTEEIQEAEERLKRQEKDVADKTQVAKEQQSYWQRQLQRNGWRRKMEAIVRGI